MADELLPLFPLGVVLLPQSQVPLHIFEERYKEMIGEAIALHAEFGIVLASGNGIVNTGCTAVVENVVERYPDGRIDIVAMGLRRFEILSLNHEKSYLRGAVQFFDDEDPEASEELRRRAVDAWRQAQDEPSELDSELPQLSFLLAQPIEELSFRQQLLHSRSESERLRRLVEFFPTWRRHRLHAEHVRAVAPQNGHGRWPLS